MKKQTEEWSPTLSIGRFTDFKSLIKKVKTLPCGLDKKLCAHISSHPDLSYSDNRFYVIRCEIEDPSQGELLSGVVDNTNGTYDIDDFIIDITKRRIGYYPGMSRDNDDVSEALNAHWIVLMHKSVELKPSELFVADHD